MSLRTAPLFGGVPGGPELLVILLVVVLLLGVPLAVLALGGALGYSLSRSRDDAPDAERVDELERELAETRAELAELREEREGTGDRSADAHDDERTPDGSRDRDAGDPERP